MPDPTTHAFRYRTGALLGPWRATVRAAVRDAIRAGQARRDTGRAGWHWAVPGRIEALGQMPLAFPSNDNVRALPRPRGA
jgi:hypothetical protein